MRARYPECDGIVARDGVEIRYERYGPGQAGDPAGCQPWSLVHSRFWKMQIPYLAHGISRWCVLTAGAAGAPTGRPTPCAFTEPHSTKQVEDATGWALETDGETLTAADRGIERCDAAATRRLAAALACPVLVIHGTDDAGARLRRGRGAWPQCTGGRTGEPGGRGPFPASP